MAKKIKFSLRCNSNKVRTLEDLKNNFWLEDVWKYYRNCLLHKWLDVRGYTEELEKVKKIKAKEPSEVIKELIKIFDVEITEIKVGKTR